MQSEATAETMLSMSVRQDPYYAACLDEIRSLQAHSCHRHCLPNVVGLAMKVHAGRASAWVGQCQGMLVKLSNRLGWCSLKEGLVDWREASVHGHRTGVNAHQRDAAILAHHVKRYNRDIKLLSWEHHAMHDLHVTGQAVSFEQAVLARHVKGHNGMSNSFRGNIMTQCISCMR